MVSAIAWRGTRVEIPADTRQVATLPAASATQLTAVGPAGLQIASAAYQPATTSAATIGVSASSLPASTAQRAIGRDHRYVPVRASISSPIDDATNIATSRPS